MISALVTVFVHGITIDESVKFLRFATDIGQFYALNPVGVIDAEKHINLPRTLTIPHGPENNRRSGDKTSLFIIFFERTVFI